MVLKRRRKAEDSFIRNLIRTHDIQGLERFLLAEDTKGVHARVAVEGLIRFDEPEAWDALGHVLTQADTAVVELAIEELTANGNSGAIRALGECLSNRNPFFRSSAVRGLSAHESAATMPHLLRATRDPEASLGRMASRIILRRVERSPNVLANLPDVTVEGILDLMDDRWAMELLSPSYPDNIRNTAALRLGDLGGDEACQTLASIAQNDPGELGQVCWQALERCHVVSDFVLLPLLVDPRPEIKSRAVALYSQHSDQTALDLISGLAADADPRVRLEALRGMARVAPVAAIPRLEAALDDLEEDVRQCAIDLLCSIEDSTPELVGVVKTQDGEVRRRALVCLANRGVMTQDLYQAYIEFLYKGSACTDLSQRAYLDSLAAVAKTLGQSQNLEVMLALTALARSVIRRLRRAAIEGLMKFPPEDRSDALFSLIDAHDNDIIKNVAFGLHEAEDERAALPMIRAAMECRGKPMVRAKEALVAYPQVTDVEFLIKALSERWASVRRYGAEQLKILKDPTAIPALLEASNDDDVEVQLAVFEAMGPFASENMDVQKRLLEGIGYGDISVRQAACEALGEARCKEAVPDLIKALHNFFLRPRASEALRRIGDRKGFLAMKRLEIREALFKKKPDDAHKSA